MIFNIFSTFIYCFISYTSAVAYLFMFLNCMYTGNLISMFFPLSVLLYALLEDPRPKNRYWSIILIYAELVILFKFLIQQNALTVLTPGSLFVEIVDKFKLGFRVFDKKEYAQGIFGFIIWDILVALSVLLHQHCLVFFGLWKKRESDIETLEEAKRRIHAQIQKKKYEQAQMHLRKEEEIRRLNELLSDFEEEEDADDADDADDAGFIKSKTDSPSKLKEEEIKLNLPQDSVHVHREKSAQIPQLSARFESGSANDISPFTQKPRKRSVMYEDHYFLKHGYFTTGINDDQKVDYGEEYFIHDYSENTENADRVSCDARIRVKKDERYSQGEPDFYCMSENNLKYYEGLDEEAVIALEADMIHAYNMENQDPEELRKAMSFQQLVLQNEFIFRIFPENKYEKPGMDLYNYGVVIQFLIVTYILFFFSQMTGEKEELSETFKFKRFRTEMIFFMFIQIMLVLLDRFFYIRNTFNKDEDKSDSSSSLDSDNEEKKKSIFSTLLHSDNRHNFIKLIVYVLLVILVHSIAIWYFPMTGNYKITEQLYCEPNSPCNDLSDNMFLWGFYGLYMAYFCVTALQFRYGHPEIRKGHFMYERVGPAYKLAFQAFFYIPFLFEIKTFIDWTFTNTALKIWEWFTFETIYSEFYGAKLSAEKDKNHNIGDPQGWTNKVIYGCTGLVACLGLILAPLVIFSSLNPIAELNLVKGASIELNIELEEGKSLYNIFSTTVANEIRNLTEEEFSLLSFRKYKELRVSDHSLYQRVEMLPYSDKIWNLSPPAIRKMRDHFELAMKTNYSEAAISLEYSFNRQYPPGSNKPQRFLKKKIMEIENYPEIFKSFYEALNSKDCKPVFIKLDRFYPSVIHLTNEIEPEVINIKYKTLNLKIFCTPDPLIGHNQVKYWTMYIDDDLDIARHKKKMLQEEEERNRISISLRPRDSPSDEDDYVYEKKETMGVSDQTNDPEKSDKPSFVETKPQIDHTIYTKPTTSAQKRSDIVEKMVKEGQRISQELQKQKEASTAKPTVAPVVNNTVVPAINNTVSPKAETNATVATVKTMNQTLADIILPKPKETQPPIDTATPENGTVKSDLVDLDFDDSLDDFEPVKELSDDSKMHIDTPLSSLPPMPKDLNITEELLKEADELIAPPKRNLVETRMKEEFVNPAVNKTTGNLIEADENELLKIDPNPDKETDIKIPLRPPLDQKTIDQIEYEKLQIEENNTEGSEQMGQMDETRHEQIKDENESAKQMGIVIYTFSDKVTPGLLQYSVITFYVSVVFVAGKLLRGYLWGSTEKIYLSELPYPDELLVI